MSITINTQSFRAKKDLKKHISAMFKTLPNEIYPDHELFPFWEELFSRHPNHTRKLNGSTIKHFIFMKPFHMLIKLANEEVVTFSWNVCITQKLASKLSDTISTMRRIIQPEIKEFASSNKMQCAKCSKKCYCEVDHIIHFKTIRENFFEEYEIDLERLKMTSNRTEVFFEDEYTKSFIDEWTLFHRKESKLQFLCVDCHMRKTRLEAAGKLCTGTTPITFGKFKGKPHSVLLEPKNSKYSEWILTLGGFAAQTQSYLIENGITEAAPTRLLPSI